MLNPNTPKNHRSGLNPIHWKIRNKIMLLVLLAAIFSVGTITLYSYFTLLQNNQTIVGEELVTFANEAIQHSADIIEGSVNSLEALALSPSIIEAVEQANQTYQGRTQADIDAEIATLDQAWKDEDPSVEARVGDIANHPVSTHLKDFMRTFPEEVEVFLTDIQGLNVAMTDRTGDYLQADEGWWQGAYNNGQGAVFISEVDYDDTAGAWAIDIGVPVRGKDGHEIIGILRGTVDISVVFDTLSQIAFGQTGYAALLDSEGKILYAHNSDLLLSQAPDTIQTALSNSTEGWRGDLTDLDGNPAVIAFRQMGGDMGEALGWTLLVEKDQQEVNTPVQRALINSLFIAALIAGLMVVAGIWAARFISQPLTIATYQAQCLSVGDASHSKAQAVDKFVDRGDEVGELLRAFRSLREYVQDMVGIAQHLANGNLATSVNTRGEKDVLGIAFDQMIVNLRALVGQVANNANQLGHASRQLSANADQSGQATAQVAATIQEMATSIHRQAQGMNNATSTVQQVARAIDNVASGAQEQAAAVAKSANITTQISTAIRQVADNAQAGASGSSQATEAARAGAHTIQETIYGMESIKTKVGLSAQKVQEMGHRSGQIGAIVETIEDIAGQTNLLALNAAIEAARAGEHGKGFAVVADEVRKLAEKSSSATREIGGLIKDIQQTVTEAVTAMDEGAVEVENGVARADEAGKALQNILSSVESVNVQVEAIAAAAQEMSASSSELVNAMDLVSAVVEENTASTEEMAAGSSEVIEAIENTAALTQENTAAIEEVSASTEEMSAQVEEVATSVQLLDQMAQNLQAIVARFRLPENE